MNVNTDDYKVEITDNHWNSKDSSEFAKIHLKQQDEFWDVQSYTFCLDSSKYCITDRNVLYSADQ